MSSFIGYSWSAFYSLNRQAELERLIQWAQRKRLVVPLKLYRQQLEDEQVRYSRYTMISPRITRFAHIIHFLTRPFRPTPCSYRKGSATGYKVRIA